MERGRGTMRTTEFPDVLLLTVDTMRRDSMAPYGADLMPAASGLLAEGVAFDRCVAPSPWTGASFGTMLSGLWPREHRCLANSPRREEPPARSSLRPDVRLLAEMLHDAGYFTVCGQGNTGYLGPGSGFTRGFDAYAVWVGDYYTEHKPGQLEKHLMALRLAGPGVYLRYLLRRRLGPRELRLRSIMQTGEAVVQAATRLARRAPDGQPLFVWVNFIDMHAPYGAPRRWMPPEESPGSVRPVHTRPWKYLDEPFGEADQAYVRRRYDNTARYVNACIETLLERLTALRRSRSLLTVFTSDHGEEFWDHGTDRADPLYYNRGNGHGHTLFNDQVRVPLFLHWPGHVAEGRRAGNVASVADLTPTLIELLELDEDTSAMGGCSLAGAATGPEPPSEDGRVVFADSLLYGAERQAAVSSRHKLVVRPDTGETQLFAWATDDPGEKTDLAASPGHSEERGKLEAALAEWNARLGGGQPAELSAEEDDEVLLGQLRELGYL